MGDIAIDQIKFSREECSFFPSSASPQDSSESGVGELIFSCFADGVGECGCSFDFGLCSGLSLAIDVITVGVVIDIVTVVIDVITVAARDNHGDHSSFPVAGRLQSVEVAVCDELM